MGSRCAHVGIRGCTGARGSPVKSASPTFWILNALVALPLCGGVLRGATLADAPLLWAFWLLFVIVPGTLVHQWLRAPEEDGLSAAGMAWMVGYALATLAYLALKISRIDGLYALYPLVMLALRRAGAGRAAPAAHPRGDWRR